MKLCKDCKHHDPKWSQCLRGEGWTNLVNGDRENRTANCYTQRDSGPIFARLVGWCGREGRYWEAR